MLGSARYGVSSIAGRTASKRTAHPAEQERANAAVAREAWFAAEIDLDPKTLVFIDETGANTKMTRLRGHAARRERCRAPVPFDHGNTTTFTAGLRMSSLSAPMLLKSPVDGDTFLAYIAQVLVPTLTVDDTVIMDNLSAHKMAGVRLAIDAAGANLLYLPPYYAPLHNAASMAIGTLSSRRSSASHRPNAPTTSQRQGMMPRDWENALKPIHR